LRILVAHNHYPAGGEDSVFGSEVELLRHAGHTVETLALSNEAIKGRGARAATALLAPYNPFGRVKMARAIGEFRPDVVHVHNFFRNSVRRFSTHVIVLAFLSYGLCTIFE
jgi:hypothetical protein